MSWRDVYNHGNRLNLNEWTPTQAGIKAARGIPHTYKRTTNCDNPQDFPWLNSHGLPTQNLRLWRRYNDLTRSFTVWTLCTEGYLHWAHHINGYPLRVLRDLLETRARYHRAYGTDTFAVNVSLGETMLCFQIHDQPALSS